MLRFAEKLGRRVRARLEDAAQPARIRSVLDPESERRFETVATKYAEVVSAASKGGPADQGDGSSYAWGDWAQEIHDAFRGGLPRTFLSHRRLLDTMVFTAVKDLPHRLDAVVAAFGAERGRRLLREDAIGRPRIVDGTFLTSANRVIHAYHLASYATRMSHDPCACASYLEWGGGYGNMARIIRKLAPGATYGIIDLAPLLGVQYVYLASLEGEGACHVVTAAAPELVPGKINFIESGLVTRGVVKPTAEMFLSTWAASESPPAAQAFIAGSGFFGARRLLLGYLKDESNRLLDAVAAAGCERVPVRTLVAEGFAGVHEYAFR